MNDKFKITIELTEREFLAIARIGYRELRSPKNQARLLLRDVLIERGALVPNPNSEVMAKAVT